MKEEMPEEIAKILRVLEAKQVLRGFKSELFPEMTKEDALEIRKNYFQKGEKNES